MSLSVSIFSLSLERDYCYSALLPLVLTWKIYLTEGQPAPLTEKTSFVLQRRASHHQHSFHILSVGYFNVHVLSNNSFKVQSEFSTGFFSNIYNTFIIFLQCSSPFVLPSSLIFESFWIFSLVYNQLVLKQEKKNNASHIIDGNKSCVYFKCEANTKGCRPRYLSSHKKSTQYINHNFLHKETILTK